MPTDASNMKPQLLSFIWFAGGSIIVCILTYGTYFNIEEKITTSSKSILRANYPNKDRIRQMVVSHFLLISDLDKSSSKKDGAYYESLLIRGRIRYQNSSTGYQIDFAENVIKLNSTLNSQHRGMELSELKMFNGTLLTFDDRTGIVYKISCELKDIIPYAIIASFDQASKGMKIEWATVKDKMLWIGSFGKEYTDSKGAEIISNRPFWIARLNENGQITYHDWQENYERLRRAAGATYPGYLIHEAIEWSSVLGKWMILPRRVSQSQYDEVLDEKRGSNVMMLASEDFQTIDIRFAGERKPERGFSSLKFLPSSMDQVIVALKTVENSSTSYQETFIVLIDTHSGQILMNETRIPWAAKFEGIEFMSDSVTLNCFEKWAKEQADASMIASFDEKSELKETSIITKK